MLRSDGSMPISTCSTNSCSIVGRSRRRAFPRRRATPHCRPSPGTKWSSAASRPDSSSSLTSIFYRGLNLAVAKRMYRFLDKRFHFSSELRFKLPVFACEHIGLSRRYDAAQLKRRLSPAIAELEQAGYLMPLAAGERFHRLRRGQWEVVFIRAAKARRQRRPLRRLSDLENRLVERGVRAASAAQLVREHAADLIEGKIAVFDALRQKQDRRISRNPAGYLVKSIRDDYSLPAGVAEKTDRRATCLALARNGPTNSAVSRRVATETGESQAEQRVREYLVHLSPAERSQLEQDALESASGIAADGFRRASGLRQ